MLPVGFEPTSSALFACTQSGAGQCCVSLLCNADSKGQDDYLSGVRPLHQGSEHRVFDRPVSLKLAVKTVRRLRLGAVRCTIRGPRLEQGSGPYQEPLCPYGCDPVHIHVVFIARYHARLRRRPSSLRSARQGGRTPTSALEGLRPAIRPATLVGRGTTT